MKRISSLIILILFFSLGVFSQKNSSNVAESVSASTPKESTIEVEFLDLPGKLNKKSVWELSYELRITDEKALYEATKTGKLKEMSLTDEKVGSLIEKGSFKKGELSQIENRKVTLRVPLDEKVREKLANAAQVKQCFLFYGSAVIFDGKLKKNIIIPLSWIWQYDIYPNAEFGMDFKIEESDENDYFYSRNTFVPEKLPKGYFKTSKSQ